MPDPEIVYTARSQQTVLEALIAHLKSRFPNDWPEFINSTVAKSILDVVAWTHGQRAFYYDMQALNSYLATATLPEAVIAIAEGQLGYKRRQASSASVEVTLYPQPPQPSSIVIQAGKKVQIDNLIFESAMNYVIPAGKPYWPDGSTSDLVIFNEGETRVEEFTSDGSSFQSFQVTQNSVIRNSIVVTILNNEWEEVDSLTLIEGSGIRNDVFIANGDDSQEYTLSALNAIINPADLEDAVTITVANVLWTQVDVFTGAANEYRMIQSSDGVTKARFGLNSDNSAPAIASIINILYHISGAQRRYTTTFTDNSRATIHFGNGSSGLVPPDGAVVSIKYRIGGGVQGNIRKGKIDAPVRGTLPSGAEMNVRVFNHRNGAGGEEKETIDSIRLRAPSFAKSNQRAVRKEDWDVLAISYRSEIYGAPAYASAKIKQKIPERNTVEVAVWSRDDQGRLAKPNLPLKLGIKNFLDSRKTMCTRIEMKDGNIIFFDIYLNVLLKEGKNLAGVLESTKTTLRDHFNSTFVKPGIDLVVPLVAQKVLELSSVEQCSVEDIIGSNLVELELGNGDDVTAKYENYMRPPNGVSIVPGTFEITDGTQTASDNSEGIISGDIDSTGVNTIDYETGHFDVTFASPPPASSFVTAECRQYAFFANTEEIKLTSNRIDGLVQFRPMVSRVPVGVTSGAAVSIVLGSEFLPYTPGRLMFIGGWDDDATQPGGQLLAYDNTDGGIFGDVLPGGTINYDTGIVNFSWNTVPPPIVSSTYYGRLLAAPNGILKSFDFEVRNATGGGGSQISLDALNGKGRIKFVTAGLTTPNVIFEDSYDNAFGKIDGGSIDKNLDNYITYEDGSGFSVGKISFNAAPEVAAGQDFIIEIAPVTLLFYASFSAYIRNDTGYDKIIMADHRGKLFGDVAQAFPYALVDYLCGRYKSDLTFPNETGKTMTISYDAFTRSKSKSLPVDSLTMPTLGNVFLEEVVRQTDV